MIVSKSLNRLAILAAAATACVPAFGAQAYDFTEQFRQASPSVVRIQTSRGTGTGFAVRVRGGSDSAVLIVTDSHVVGNDASVEIFPKGKHSFTAPVIKRYPEPFNLAFIEASSTGIPPLRWAAFAPEIGSPVFLIGTPEIGNDNGPLVASGTLITGVVSNYLEMGLMITDAQISTGTCGGPLLNARGEVVGIARPATNRPGINFVLPSHNVEGRVPDWQYMLSRTIERNRWLLGSRN